MNGSTRPYRTASGESWEYVIELGRGPDGRRKQARRRGFPTHAAAEAAMQAELTDRRRGQYIDPSTTPLGSYLADWLAATAPTRADATNRQHRGNIARAHAIHHIPLAKLQPHTLQQWVNSLTPAYAPRTIKQTVMTVNAALAQAVAWSLIPANPASGLKRPRLPTRRELPNKTWTAEECAAFLTVEKGGDWYAVWRVLLDAQLRVGEALALNWDNIDLAAGIIHVRQTLHRNAAGSWIISDTTKTPSSIRDVTIPPETVAALRRQRARQAERRLIAGPAWTDHNLVFSNHTGAPQHPSAIGRALASAIAAANVPRISPHGLRHTGATLLILAGVPLVVVSRRLGHSGISITADIYAHVTIDADRSAADVIARVINA